VRKSLPIAITLALFLVTNTFAADGQTKPATPAKTESSPSGFVRFRTGPNSISANQIIKGTATANVYDGANIWEDGSGNIGIGTTGSLSQKFVVNGNMQLLTGGYLYGNTTSQNLLLSSSNGSRLSYDASNSVNIGSNVIWFNNNTGEAMRIQSGHVGIGTNNPAYPLHIVLPVTEPNPDTLLRLAFSDGYFMDFTRRSINVRNNDFILLTSDSSASSERMRILNGNGFIGINTDAPQRLLHVSANVNSAEGVRISNANAGTTAYAALQFKVDTASAFSAAVFQNSSTNPAYGGGGSLNLGTIDASPVSLISGNLSRVFLTATGDLGVGISPTTRFDVLGPAAAGSDGARRVMRIADNTALAAGIGGGLNFDGHYDTNAANYSTFTNVQGLKTNATAGDKSGKFVLNVSNSTGNMVEIASADTATGLKVTGNGRFTGDVTVDGNIAAKYQDVAEWVPATTHMDPGTVVVLNRQHKNEVMPSARSYDTAVAGVVSAQPGVILGVAGDSKAQIATTGRVKVHVDAAAGPIEIGDLLVTSDKSGTAMKSQPVDLGGVSFHRPGTVIGKALEPLAAGEGEILVLLSLQ